MNEERLFIVYTDIVGHTRLIDRVGQGFRPMRRVHDELFRQACENAGGAHCCVGTGDGFYAGFTTAGAAIDTALTFRRRLAATDWDQYLSPKLKGPENAVKARVGVHCGLVKVRYAGTEAADFDGLPRNTCDKLCALAKGNQVLLSREVWDEVRLTYTNAGELEHTPFGFFKPKDCKEVLEVFAVAESGGDLGPPPEQPAEYAAVMFAYIDEALELLDRMGDDRYDQQLVRLEAVLGEVVKKHAPAAFMKRLGRDGYLLAADSDVEMARVGLEFRRAVYARHKRGELSTVLKMGADCGTVHYAYGPRGREDVRDQPCNIAAKIAGKFANRWQLLISDRVKRNAHARLSDRDDYQWVSLGRRDPVGSGESFDVLDLRDTRVRTDERPVLWVDFSSVLIQLGGVAEALKRDLLKRTGELFERAAGSCKMRPLRAEHPAGFYAVFDDPLEAFDTAVDFHAACVAEPFESGMAGLKRRHKRDSLARVGLALGQVTTSVVNGWVDAPEGPGVDAARQVMMAQEGAGVTVLVGNSMRTAVQQRIAALGSLAGEVRAGRPPASFTGVRVPKEWPEATLGKVWGVEAEAGVAGRVNPAVKWGLLAAAIAVVGAPLGIVVQQKLSGGGGGVVQVAEAAELTQAKAAFRQALETGGGKAGELAAAVRRDVDAEGNRLIAGASGRPRAEQVAIVPQLLRLAAVAEAVAAPSVFAGSSQGAAAQDYQRADGKDVLRAWRDPKQDLAAWVRDVARAYAPHTPPVDAAGAAAAAREAARQAAFADGATQADRESLDAAVRRLDGAETALRARSPVRRYAAEVDAAAAGVREAAGELATLAGRVRSDAEAAVKSRPVQAAQEGEAARAVRTLVAADLIADGPREVNVHWKSVIGPWAIDRLRGDSDGAATRTALGPLAEGLRSAWDLLRNLPEPEPPAEMQGRWREAYTADTRTRRAAALRAWLADLPAEVPESAGDYLALAERLKDGLRELDDNHARDLRALQAVMRGLDGGALPGARLRDLGTFEEDVAGQTVAEWFEAARDSLGRLEVKDAVDRLLNMTAVARAESLQELRRAQQAGGAMPEIVSTAWARLADPALLGIGAGAEYLAECAAVLDRAGQVEAGAAAARWTVRHRAMCAEAPARAAAALGAARGADVPAVEIAVQRLAAAAKHGGIDLEVALDEGRLLPARVSMGRVLRAIKADFDAADRAAAEQRRQLFDGTAARVDRLRKWEDARTPALEARLAALEKALRCEQNRQSGAAPVRDFARLGPAVNEGRWRYAAEAGGARLGDLPALVRYEYWGDLPRDLSVANGTRPGVNTLEFRLLTQADGRPLLDAQGEASYLCTTAVSVGVLMIQAAERGGDFTPGSKLWGEGLNTLREVAGPLGWSVARDRRIDPMAPSGGFRPPRASAWLARADYPSPVWLNFDKYARDGALFAGVSDQSPHEPSAESPVQLIRADAAVFLARTLGARLPTEGEFAAAFDMEAAAGGGGAPRDPASWNLRDQSVAATEAQIAVLLKSVPALPNLSGGARVFEAARAAAGGVYPSNDGVVLFTSVAKPIRPGPYLFMHLVGNVATYVFADAALQEGLNAGPQVSPGSLGPVEKQSGDFGVAGRSALSAVVDPAQWRAATSGIFGRIADDVRRRAFGDVGLRLAFTAKARAADSGRCEPTFAQAYQDILGALEAMP